jgi:hypothetical protein
MGNLFTRLKGYITRPQLPTPTEPTPTEPTPTEPTPSNVQKKGLFRRLVDWIKLMVLGEELLSRKDVKLPPRQWGAELYEFFIEYNLNINSYDTHGLTEKLTIAWLTPRARKKRANSKYTWGPYGLFSNCYGSKET